MKKCVAVALVLLCSSFIRAQNFNFKFCLIQKDATNIAFEFTVCNNTAASINPFTFVFNWPGVSNITVDNGMDVIKNGNGGIVELTKQSWGQPLNPGCNNKFTVRMNYEFGMFPPTWGMLNGDTIKGITCYVPPSFENFKCKKDFNATCFLGTGSEIKIGEGTVRAWNSTRDVYVPANRKSWPISMAVAHTMFNNLMGFDCMTANEYFATAMQESSCGCDGGVTAPAWVTNAYNIQPTNYCADLTHGVAAGFFQEEYGTGWVELEKDIPCFIPTASFDKFIIGSKFETQAIGKVYHDFNNISYWQYIKCWNPIDFLKNSKDPYATEKLIALGYNRGLNSGEIGSLLTTNRAPAMAATNILPYLNPGGVGWVYAEQISRISAVLDNNMSAVDPADPQLSSVPYPGIHSFHGFYDAPISWMDISNYIDVIAPMYAGVGLNAVTFKNTIQKVFNSVKGGGDVSFRYELSPVIDAIVLNLPAFDPKFGLGGMYVNSGGSTCKYPTAALTKSDTVCMGNPLTLTVKLTGTSPWSFSYENPKGAIVTLTNITTSPYVFTVPDTGIYHLVSVKDAIGTGEAICEPIIKAYFNGGGVADLVAISTTPCGPKSLQIKFTGKGPYDIEYSINGVAQPPVNGIIQNPYTLVPSAAPAGTYILTRLKANGCDMKLKDTVIISPLSIPKIDITGDTIICRGQSTQLTVQSTNSIATYTWSPATGLNSINTAIVKASPVTTTKYIVTATDANGCVTKDSVILIVNPPPVITVSADTAICFGEKITLTATGGTGYNWSPATGLNVTNTASVIASPVITTKYTVVVTDGKGCKAKDSVVVDVNSLPTVTVSSDTTICFGEKAILTATGGASYSWSPATGLNVTNAPTVIATPAATTQYIVTATSIKGCNAKNTVNVNVILCGFTVTVKGGSVCEGNCYTLSAKGSGGTAPYSYTWQPGGLIGDSITVCPVKSTTFTVIATDATGSKGQGIGILTVIPKPTIQVNSESVCKGDPATLIASGAATYSWSTGAKTATISVNPLVTTTYTVTGATVEGCMDTAFATVSIKSKPTVNFGRDTAGCAPFTAKFINLSSDLIAGTTCSWDFGNSKKSKACEPDPVLYSSPGTYSVTLTVNNGGCIATVTRPCITVYPAPKAFFTADPETTDLYNPIVMFTDVSTNANKSTWSFGDGTVDSSNVNAVTKHTYKEAGVYKVCLKAEMSSCEDEYCSDVTIKPGWSFYIPNAFTPDEDGLNPVFSGRGENISEYSLMIFNRWGNLVFETKNVSNGWNGKMNNGAEMAQQDVYVYKVRFKDNLNKTHEYIGSVTLLK